MGSPVRETPYSEITATLEILERFGVKREDFAEMRKDEKLARQIAEVLAGIKQTVVKTFSVTVDYSKSLKEIIADCNLDSVNDDITEKHFLINGSGKSEAEVELELELVRYNEEMMYEQVLADFKVRDLKPAPIEVGLAFNKENPNFQRRLPIIMLGSVWQDNVSYLWSGANERGLGLSWIGDSWHGDCLFLAVRKS